MRNHRSEEYAGKSQAGLATKGYGNLNSNFCYLVNMSELSE